MTDIPQSTIDELRRLSVEKASHKNKYIGRDPKDISEAEFESIGDTCIQLEDMVDKYLITLLTALESARANERRYLLWREQMMAGTIASSMKVRNAVDQYWRGEKQTPEAFDAAIDAAIAETEVEHE